jgi:hypothetical protein
MGWDISVSIAMGFGLGDWDSIPGRGKRLFFTPQSPNQLWGTRLFFRW